MNPMHKNCPHFLMTNGRPGRKWNDFLKMVKSEYDRIYIPSQIASMRSRLIGIR
tara:strand:- start:311 stop:472 length:162 start_codon:yes stop_codon:yes gene_type:complete